MTATRIDGKAFAEQVYEDVVGGVKALKYDTFYFNFAFRIISFFKFQPVSFLRKI